MLNKDFNINNNRRCSVLDTCGICFISHEIRASGQHHNAHLGQAFFPPGHGTLWMLKKRLCFFSQPTVVSFGFPAEIKASPTSLVICRREH